MRGMLLALTPLVFALPLGAQEMLGSGCRSANGGTIAGIVKDSSGKGIPTVAVRLTDIECLIYSARVIRTIDSETFEGSVSYYAAPLAGATWVCRYKKERGAWIPKSCRMTVIS